MKRVLILEPNLYLASVLKNLLDAAYAECVCADSPEEAKALLETEAPFDLVVSDLDLGDGASGLDLWSFCAAHHSGLAFVLVTEKAEAAALPPGRKGAKAPVKLAKPFTVSEVTDLARSILL